VAGIDHGRPNAHRLQRRIWALPVDARTFHDHFVRIKRRRPGRQQPPVLFEGAKLPLLDACLAIRFLKDRARRDLGLMNVESDDSFVDWNQFHTVSFRNTLKGGKRWVPEPKLPEGDRSPAALLTKNGKSPGSCVFHGNLDSDSRANWTVICTSVGRGITVASLASLPSPHGE
jgi:hypothetical protein